MAFTKRTEKVISLRGSYRLLGFRVPTNPLVAFGMGRRGSVRKIPEVVNSTKQYENGTGYCGYWRLNGEETRG